MHTIQHNIDECRHTILVYMGNHSIFADYREAERRQGSVPRQRWWEQRMCLDAHNEFGSGKLWSSRSTLELYGVLGKEQHSGVEDALAIGR
jgi:hypothetical protein